MAQEERCQWQVSQRQKSIFMLESKWMNSAKSHTSSRSFQRPSEWWSIVLLNPGKNIAPMFFHPSCLPQLRDQVLGQCMLKMSISTEAAPMSSWESGLQHSSVVPLQPPLFSSRQASPFYFWPLIKNELITKAAWSLDVWQITFHERIKSCILKDKTIKIFQQEVKQQASNREC